MNTNENLRVSLIEITDKVFVVAHKRDTSLLEEVLTQQGFTVRVQRGPYTTEQEDYSAQLKCMVNHANVWRQVALGTEPAIVVEDDFVPVKSFAGRTSPMPNVKDDAAAGFAWLYSAGSILYGFDKYGFPHGHGNTTVAYMLTPPVARMLLKFFERETAKVADGRYSPWETYLGIYLRKEQGVLNYIPIYQFGEHGGIPNPEHSVQGVRAWHQADVLMATLAFSPQYAQGRPIRYLAYRSRAYARAWARLLLLRFYDPRYINADTTRGRMAMAWFSITRLLKLA
jgi:hypothetical protein